LTVPVACTEFISGSHSCALGSNAAFTEADVDRDNT